MALTLHGTVSDNTVALDRKTATPLIINGDMRIAQRGDQTGVTAYRYINIDRFFINMINLGTWSFTQSTDTPTGLGFASSLKINFTTQMQVQQQEITFIYLCNQRGKIYRY